MKKIILFLILLGAIALVYNDYTKRFEAKKVEKVQNQMNTLITTFEEKSNKLEEKKAKISEQDTEGMKKIEEEERQLEEEAQKMEEEFSKNFEKEFPEEK